MSKSETLGGRRPSPIPVVCLSIPSYRVGTGPPALSECHLVDTELWEEDSGRYKWACEIPAFQVLTVHRASFSFSRRQSVSPWEAWHRDSQERSYLGAGDSFPRPHFSIRIFVFHASEVSLIFKQRFIKTKRLVANKPSDLSSHSLAKIARGK